MKYYKEIPEFGTQYYCINDAGMRCIRVTKMDGGYFHIESVAWFNDQWFEALILIEKAEFESAYSDAIQYFSTKMLS